MLVGMASSMMDQLSANLVPTNVLNVLEPLIFVLNVQTNKIEFKTQLVPVLTDSSILE